MGVEHAVFAREFVREFELHVGRAVFIILLFLTTDSLLRCLHIARNVPTLWVVGVNRGAMRVVKAVAFLILHALEDVARAGGAEAVSGDVTAAFGHVADVEDGEPAVVEQYGVFKAYDLTLDVSRHDFTIMIIPPT